MRRKAFWRKTIVLAGLLMTAACTTETATSPVTEAPVARGHAVRFTAASAGPVTAETAYSASSLGALMPQFQIKPIETANENNTTSALAAFSNGLQVMQFLRGSNGRVGEVFGVSENIVGPNGERLGMTFRQARVSHGSCRMGGELWTDMAICPAPGTRNVFLVFAVPQYRGPLDKLPPPAELDGAELQRIVWRPA